MCRPGPARWINHPSCAGPAQPVGKITPHVLARADQLENSSLMCQPGSLEKSFLMCRPVGKITSHMPALSALGQVRATAHADLNCWFSVHYLLPCQIKHGNLFKKHELIRTCRTHLETLSFNAEASSSSCL